MALFGGLDFRNDAGEGFGSASRRTRSGWEPRGFPPAPLMRRLASEGQILPRRSLRVSTEKVFGDARCAAAIVPSMAIKDTLEIRSRTEEGAHVEGAFRPLRLGSWCHDGRLSSACRKPHSRANSYSGEFVQYGRANPRPRWSQRQSKISVPRSIAIGDCGFPAKKRRTCTFSCGECSRDQPSVRLRAAAWR